MKLVKGVSRRVIVIKSPDKNIFEEAIFIVKEDAVGTGITRDALVREAQQVANEYLASNCRKKKRAKKLPGMMYALLGVGVFGVVYLMMQLI